MEVLLRPGKKLYFASDFHLGSYNSQQGRQREQVVVRWLDSLRPDAQAVFLVGDLFDFWFEYRQAIPKGFVRFLGKVAELKDAGIDVYFFTGNHDLWMADYFPQELGIPVFHQPIELSVRYSPDDQPGTDTRFLVGHGDGLGPGDWTYKNVLKPVFTNQLIQRAFRFLHPDVGIWLAHRWSRHSRLTKAGQFERFKGEEQEWLYHHCRAIEAQRHHDYYLFGHRHLALDLKIGAHSRYINLGEWVNIRSYAVFDGRNLSLEWFEKGVAKNSPV